MHFHENLSFPDSHVDLIQAAAARLVWSTAVARRRRGWVALERCAVQAVSTLVIQVCHLQFVTAKWLHRSSEDGFWRDIKLLQAGRGHDVQSDCIQLPTASYSNFSAISFSVWSKRLPEIKLVSSKACDWLLWSSVWRWYLQTPMIQGSKLQKPRDLRTGPRAASC